MHHHIGIPYTPDYVIIGYSIVAVILAVVLVYKTKALKKFSTLDYVYVGIGGAAVAVLEHIIGDAIFVPAPFYPWINPPIIFRVLSAFVVVGIVRKFGAGMLTMGVYDIVSDIIHFSFYGEPLWLFEDVITYGLMADIAILVTKGNLFNSKRTWLNPVEGGVLGFAWSFTHPFFTYGFIAPLVFGFIPNVGRIFFLFETYAVTMVILGVIAAILANRIIKLIL
ncbi:hypothetical protein DFR86_00485 [Acidianus sulfidivorans JP7]|uniref:Uncharacterized protein n=1 Tax=Acidianus sulfidivorans JP7 TaxID=619593 RepID=A0A2U9IJG2_9CREN|nr:hypothetical protein [Acidianus sulfidivorans]AWR96171.1 hypothetical protein DFR86_00485 [Acidianus sulfidivorans JP7]